MSGSTEEVSEETNREASIVDEDDQFHELVSYKSNLQNSIDTLQEDGQQKTESNISSLPPNGEFLHCLLLSVWDNVVGPDAIFTWKRTDLSKQEEERLQSAIHYTVSHSLHGELGKNSLGSLRKARGHEMYLVEDASLIVYSVPFTASRVKMHFVATQQDTSPQLPHSLALILSGFHLQKFRALQPLIHLYMQRFACCVRAYLHKGGYDFAVKQLTPLVEQFCANLSSLIRPSNYIYALEEESANDWTGFLPILDLVITSHLQTCGCTVVVGDSVKEINSMIRILAQYLQPKERCRVRFASHFDSPPYHPGILIQGMLKNLNGEINILTEDVLCNVLPTTIVDLSQEQVLRSWLLHEHIRQRQIQFKRELVAILCDQKSKHTFTENVFEKVTESSRLVTDFVHKVWAIESEVKQRRILTQIFCKQLEYHALALIKLFNANYNREPSTIECPRHVYKAKLIRKLDLNDESDFLVVLATAEKLQQGIYHAIMN